jgi:hypothetical protein
MSSTHQSPVGLQFRLACHQRQHLLTQQLPLADAAQRGLPGVTWLAPDRPQQVLYDLNQPRLQQEPASGNATTISSSTSARGGVAGMDAMTAPRKAGFGCRWMTTACMTSKPSSFSYDSQHPDIQGLTES